MGLARQPLLPTRHPPQRALVEVFRLASGGPPGTCEYGPGGAAARGLSWGPQVTGTSPRCRWEGAPATPSPAPGPAPLFSYLVPFPLGHLYSLLICSSVFFAVSCIANTFRLLWLIMGFQPMAWINLVVKDALPVLHWSQGRHWKHPSPVSTSEQTGPLPQHIHLNIMKCD